VNAFTQHLEDLLDIAREAVRRDVAVRDCGLLESAPARPRASVFGRDAYQISTLRPPRC
jgi:death-on-curing protein